MKNNVFQYICMEHPHHITWALQIHDGKPPIEVKCQCPADKPMNKARFDQNPGSFGAALKLEQITLPKCLCRSKLISTPLNDFFIEPTEKVSMEFYRPGDDELEQIIKEWPTTFSLILRDYIEGGGLLWREVNNASINMLKNAYDNHKISLDDFDMFRLHIGTFCLMQTDVAAIRKSPWQVLQFARTIALIVVAEERVDFSKLDLDKTMDLETRENKVFKSVVDLFNSKTN